MSADAGPFQYHRRPAVIEAVQWNGKRLDAVPKWLSDAIQRGPMRINGLCRSGDCLDVWTVVDGILTAKPSDWLTWIDGSLGVMRESQFFALYSPTPVDALAIVREVAAMTASFEPVANMPTPFSAGFALACEEIECRLEGRPTKEKTE